MSTATREPSPYRGARPGGRSARVRAAVLDAAFELLGEGGYDALTFPEVARRAGVHPTTVYRRWYTKQGLLTDAMLAYAERQLPAPDTGSLRADLRELLDELIEVLSQKPVRALLSVVVADPSEDAELSRQRARYWRERFSLAAPVVERAVTRGELLAGVDTSEFVEAVAAPVYMRALVTGRRLDASFLDQHIERTIAAFAPTAARTAGGRRR
jgi:AcrR family transcriptional regulator